MNSAKHQQLQTLKTTDLHCFNKKNNKLSKSMEPELRIVLLGKTGVGRSASGNTILGEKRFDETLSPESKTDHWKKETTVFNGKTLTITDTPGFYHTSKEREALVDEILKSTLKIQPSPHVLLLVLSLGSAFSRADKKVLDTFQKIFPDAKSYTIVLFTHGDECDAEEFIKKNKSLDEFINRSCAEKHVFNNDVEDDAQRTGLLEKIDKVVEENGGRCYTNEMFEEAKTALMEAMKKVNTEPEGDSGKAIALLEGLINKGDAFFKEYDPGLYEVVSSLLEKVKKVACKCMPKGTF